MFEKEMAYYNKNKDTLYERYTALGMRISLSSRYKDIGEQLKVLRNKGSRFFLVLSIRS